MVIKLLVRSEMTKLVVIKLVVLIVGDEMTKLLVRLGLSRKCLSQVLMETGGCMVTSTRKSTDCNAKVPMTKQFRGIDRGRKCSGQTSHSSITAS